METLRSVAPWAPILLLAENLRVRNGLISAILSRYSVSWGLTGCVRDIRQLWNFDHRSLFDDNGTRRPNSVVSARYGNSFDLSNGAILEAAGITGQCSTLGNNQSTAKAFRETVVHVSLIIPADVSNPSARWCTLRGWMATASSVLMALVTLSLASWAAQRSLVIAPALLVCLTACHIITPTMGISIRPIFSNQATVESDRIRTTRRRAALDVHIVADSWNSSRISVLCGYSSQLHAVTNITVRTSRPRLLKWLSRLLSVVLAAQAVLLAATTNADGDER